MIYVVPEHRGRGLGLDLARLIESEMRARGVSMLSFVSAKGSEFSASIGRLGYVAGEMAFNKLLG
jgi:ribosomal protein S18 acetylase RimI-like enzyme